jgi:hypothetical protein
MTFGCARQEAGNTDLRRNLEAKLSNSALQELFPETGYLRHGSRAWI